MIELSVRMMDLLDIGGFHKSGICGLVLTFLIEIGFHATQANDALLDDRLDNCFFKLRSCSIFLNFRRLLGAKIN